MEYSTQVVPRRTHEANERMSTRSRPTVDPAPERVTVTIEANERVAVIAKDDDHENVHSRKERLPLP